jgi:glycosyltransferase involved in cell wall biosynthesis
MKVLLVSPLPKIDPACGDIIYTETLLTYPPDGVEYVTYADAISDGSLVEHASRRRFRKEPLLTACNKIINIARSRRMLFWEPFRYFSVRPGVFDLIHVHVFSVRFLSSDCPVVLSNAAPLRSLYKSARGYSPARLAWTEAAERALGWAMNVSVTSYRPKRIARIIAFTDYLKRWYVSHGVMAEESIDVVPIYLPDHARQRSGAVGRTVGFIAKDFEAKGGPVLLRAFEKVRQSYSDAELVIVGCNPQLSADEQARRGIRWLSYVPRDLLLDEVLPSFDVFAYPTGFDGQPLVVLEALRAGVPVITSDFEAVPELVDHGCFGPVVRVGDADGLATAIIRLLDPAENLKYRRLSRERFERQYSADVVRPQVLATYKRALTAA